MRVERFALAAAVCFGAALCFYPALALPTRRRRGLLAGVQAVVLVAPFIVPPEARLLRFLAAVLAVTFTVKLYDLHVGAGLGARPQPLRFAVFLWNPFSLVDRRIDDHPDPPRGTPLGRFVRCSLALLAASALAVGVVRVDWSRLPFAAEHVVKVVTFFLVLFPFTGAALVVWQQLGGRGRDIMNNPFASRTPADFWRRYNRPVHEFLQEDVFNRIACPARLRGREARARAWAAWRATGVVFVLSAAIHEYVFAVPIGRAQGYQTAFFLLQGCAVAATMRVRPRGWRVWPWVAATFAFNLATGVLFFASLNHVVRIYQNRPPLWDERVNMGSEGRPARGVNVSRAGVLHSGNSKWSGVIDGIGLLPWSVANNPAGGAGAGVPHSGQRPEAGLPRRS